MDDSNTIGCRGWLAIGASVATIIGLVWAIFTYVSPSGTRQEGYTPQSYQPTFTRQPTYTPYPTYTSPPRPTNTERVVAENTKRPTATHTKAPTSSPTPRPTSTPTQENTLFKDDFNNGLGPGWQVVFGNPVVVDDQLTATEETWLIAGNSSWADYEVKFDYDTSCHMYNLCHVLNGVRVQNPDNMVTLKWGAHIHTWQNCQDGQCTKIAEDIHGGVREWEGPIIITVSGDKVSARAGERSLGSMNFNGFASGKILIGLEKHTKIDNFRVVPLD